MGPPSVTAFLYFYKKSPATGLFGFVCAAEASLGTFKEGLHLNLMVLVLKY
jgi:hypothetical protein